MYGPSLLQRATGWLLGALFALILFKIVLNMVLPLLPIFGVIAVVVAIATYAVRRNRSW